MQAFRAQLRAFKCTYFQNALYMDGSPCLPLPSPVKVIDLHESQSWSWGPDSGAPVRPRPMNKCRDECLTHFTVATAAADYDDNDDQSVHAGHGVILVNAADG